MAARLKLTSRLYSILAIIVILSLACALPWQKAPSAPASSVPSGAAGAPLPTQPSVPTRAATATPMPLPPALVESNPPPGAEIALAQPITFYFNQPMDHASVEGALIGQPTLSGSFSWQGDTVLTFTPDSPFLPETDLAVTITTTARSRGGLVLINPQTINYRTTGYLRLTQALPEPSAQEIDPSSSIVAAFNRPVVPLGADPASLPPAFSLTPQAAGRGEWINTSVYIFFPEPGLAGGAAYTVQIDPTLTGVDGAPLSQPQETGMSSVALPLQWSFTTAAPRLVSVQPADPSLQTRLDTPIILTFNQGMDPQSVELHFALFDPAGLPVTGKFDWDENLTTLIFTPTQRLARNATYTISLDATAQSRGGSPLGIASRTSFHTYPDFVFAGSNIFAGAFLEPHSILELYFSSPLPYEGYQPPIVITPTVPGLNIFVEGEGTILRLFGDFAPDARYELAISASLQDEWGERLGQDHVMEVLTSGYSPNLSIPLSTDVVFMTPQDTGLSAQVVNLPEVRLGVGSVPLEDFMTMLGPNGYDIRRTYSPADMTYWEQSLDLPRNRTQTINIPLTPGGGSLPPGLYYLRLDLKAYDIYTPPYLIVVGNAHLTFKISAVDALVWAVDLRDQSLMPGAAVTVYDEDGSPLASGFTGQDGVFKSAILSRSDYYRTSYAVLGRPGEDSFGLALSNWNQGVAGWDFGYTILPSPPRLKTYIYTDRPIYRPGQTVYFRAVARQAANGRYSMPDIKSLPLKVYGEMGQELASFDLPLSAFGTAHGQFDLPLNAAPGFYRLGNDQDPGLMQDAITFQVASYRKPEINLQVAFNEEQALAGGNLFATLNARYYFDAPASNAPVHWVVYVSDSYFDLPGYAVGPASTGWLDYYPAYSYMWNELIAQGDAQTGADGLLSLQIPTLGDKRASGRRLYTLEVTILDESGLPVSARASIQVNPGPFYIGVKPDVWVGKVGSGIGFEVVAVDWDGDQAGERLLHADFQKVTWKRVEPGPENPSATPTYVPEYLTVGATDFATGADGLARLQFTPSEPGTYQLSISGEKALTQVTLWVGGEGEAVWPDLPNQRLRLTADQAKYQPGQTAQVFIPNPFAESSLALITTERSQVMTHQIIRLEGAGYNLSLPLTDRDAPNFYLSVTVLGKNARGEPDFRQGYLELVVEPLQQILHVSLTSQPERSGPGEQVTFSLRVTNADGQPVEGEFSLSVVDLAVLALADPNTLDILPAFYGPQPLGVQTGVALVAYTHRLAYLMGGIGGGGEGAPAMVARENFPDTAYWNAEITTDANGQAEVTLRLPDSLTTWQVDVRGLTIDGRVGQARTQIITTKELLIRPVTPRFLVVDDHAQLAAVVHNNTASGLQAQVFLQTSGFILDDPASASQAVTLPAGGRLRLEWWGTAQDVEAADLVFSVAAGDLQDAVRVSGRLPNNQPGLPVLRYSALQTFATSGVLEDGGERLEVVSLPQSFDPRGGDFRLELAPSLAAAMLDGLEALEHYPYECSEQTLSRFLPNLEAYRALQEFGLEMPDLKARLERTLDSGLDRLLARQNPDGGWGWWQSSSSDPYITAYVLFGLSRAVHSGVAVQPAPIQRASEFLSANLPANLANLQSWQLDRLAFEVFALVQAGAGNPALSNALYNQRDQLSPWTQALLALTFQKLSPSDERIKTLVSDIQSQKYAVRSASGVFWRDRQLSWQNLNTPVTSSAMVVYALAQLEPASPLLPEAVRYLMAHRQAAGGWASTYETAWTILSLTQVMKGTGELAGNFDFSAWLNGVPIASGRAAGDSAALAPIAATLPLSSLYPQTPNALQIQRGQGAGRLYYRAFLNVYQPVESVTPLNRGLSITRRYYPSNCPKEGCDPVQSARVGEMITVRLTLVVPNDMYYLVVEDYLPAGAEILDTSLKTSQQGIDVQPGPLYNASNPFESGWGWWFFHPAQIYDNHISWATDFLPAGTYELTYVLVILQPGEYRVLPARAWQFYFPEVQGASPGALFTIKPRE